MLEYFVCVVAVIGIEILVFVSSPVVMLPNKGIARDFRAKSFATIGKRGLSRDEEQHNVKVPGHLWDVRKSQPCRAGIFSRTIPAEPFRSREIPAFFPQTWIAKVLCLQSDASKLLTSPTLTR